MSDYTQITDFSVKDGLASGEAEKIILGADFDAEFAAIETAVATKFDVDDLASEVQAEALTLNTVLLTPLRLDNVFKDNGGFLSDIQALADPGADRVLFWDDSASAVAQLAIGTGLSISGTTLSSDDSAISHDSLSGFVADEHIAHSGVTLTAGAGLTGGGTIAASRSFAVGAGDGITVNADDIALTDQAVTSSVPVGLSSGALTFDLSSITEITGPGLNSASDKFLVSDAGVLKAMPYNETGIKVQTVTGTTDTLTQSDLNNLIQYNNASAITVTLNNGVGTVGGSIIIVQEGAGQVSLAGTATLRARNGTSTAGQDAVMVLTQIAANEWVVYGDTTT